MLTKSSIQTLLLLKMHTVFKLKTVGFAFIDIVLLIFG